MKNRLTEGVQTHINVNGAMYALNTSYRNALLSWDAIAAAQEGEISPFAAAYAACNNMLGVDIGNWNTADIDAALREIAAYLVRYSRATDNDKCDNRPPVIDLDKDAIMISDAFGLLGVDLDAEEISYPRFMSLLRLVSTTKAPLCRVVYLRQQWRDNKLTKEEIQEIKRAWGWDVIKIRSKKVEKREADNHEHFNQLINERRAAEGLPPK